MQKFSYLKSGNAGYIDDVLERYLKDPTSVDESWRYLFEGLELGTEIASEQGAAPTPDATVWSDESKVAELILTYRNEGHLAAHIDPLSDAAPTYAGLNHQRFGLTDADLDRSFQAGKLIGIGTAPLKDIIARLKATYCASIGVELAHIQDPTKRDWIRGRIEAAQNRDTLDAETRKMIFRRLAATDGFEKFLHTRYVAAKRFSVEGGDAIIPSIDCAIEVGAELGTDEYVIGMAHRGRLNVLTHIFGKPYAQMFTEFEGTYKSDPDHGEGDVKYHKGYSRDLTTRKGKQVHLSLAYNPSHLEFVNAVVAGSVRARQDRKGAEAAKRVVPILIHGDAAFAGQGICYETVQMAGLAGYNVGGTIHFIINNQVGFTTHPRDSRTARYSSDLGKMLDCPILHVNGDDVEAAWWAARLAIEWRQKFGTDFFIDIVCYRKHGHNEGDEPSFTQPVMYKKIKTHPAPREIYALKLAQAGIQSVDEAQKVVEELVAEMDAAQKLAKAEPQQPYVSVFDGPWKGMRAGKEKDLFTPVKTTVDAKTLLEIARKINAMPAGFTLHSKLTRFFDARLKAVTDGTGIDWGCGEALAFASLVAEGHPVRITGQDAERGTFTHRHAVLSDSENGARINPIAGLAAPGAHFSVYNSLLSETAVMGFEYGYALAEPKALVIWEGQFGDFANGAQVIIDQFIATSETKWQRMQALVLLLPHGYEGQGPEHSSARLERFLTLCGRGNMIVANFTTPAQLFHALRRQVKREFRKPMVVMSPKSMLRHPQAVSTLKEFTDAGFQEVLDCPHTKDAKSVKRVLLCSGKVYYDLVAARADRKRDDVAIVRVEQLYPWPAARLAEILARYPHAEFVWAQEEPRNMGAWTFVFNHWAGGLDSFSERVDGRGIRYVGREIAASPAVGSPKVHEAELKAFLEKAFV